ncbi:MAG: hypothetical protein IIU28_01700 [Lachnospiraceae bacterium]|nr:hypothetical protein [Lachnospiraceae bacterium]
MASIKNPKHIWFKALAVLLTIIFISFIIYMLMMVPDYKLSFDGGPHWVSKVGIPICYDYTIDNSIGKELTFSTTIPDGVFGVEYRVSYFKDFTWTGKTYQSSSGNKTVGGLTPEHTYYIQARYYRMNMMGRRVMGQWSNPRAATVIKVRVAGQ